MSTVPPLRVRTQPIAGRAATLSAPGKAAVPSVVMAGMEVEIWSDIVCPWCYLGKRHFEQALEEFGHRDEVDVVYRSFELDPSAPAGVTSSTVEHLASKYGMTPQQAEDAQRQMEQRAAEEGLTFRLEGL